MLTFITFPNKIILKIILLTLILTLIVCKYSFAQTWKFLGGPQGIYPNDILFTKSGRLLCSTYEGVFISTDYGDTWKNVPTSSTFQSFHGLSERMNGNILAVTENGIACSKDSGETWAMIYKIYGLNYYANEYIAESPKDSSLFFAIDSLVFKSTDNGKDWTNVWTGSGFIDSYAINDSGDIFIGERFGKLLRSNDGGVTFKPYPIGYKLDGLSIEQLMLNHFGGIYLKVYGYPYSIFHYENNKVTEINSDWTDMALGLTADGNLIYKSGNTLAVYNHLTRQSTFLPNPGFVKDQFAQKEVTFGNVWITSFSSHGLHRSTDGGNTWSAINNGLGCQQCLSIYLDSQDNVYTGTFGFAFWGGLYKSQDNGKSWENLNLQNSDSYVTHIYSGSNGYIIAGASYGVYVSPNAGNSWSQASGVGLVYGLYVSKGGIIYDGDIYNGLCISTDNGSGFTQVKNGLDKSLFFGFGESKTGRIFAASWPNGLYYSDDNGNSWTETNGGLFTYNEAYNFQYKGDTLFASTSGGVAVSFDNGISWNMLPGLFTRINKILISPYGDLLAAVANKGIFVTENNGNSWDSLGNGLSNLNVNDIAFDKFHFLYAATNSGIYSLESYFLPKPIFPENGQMNLPAVITLNWQPSPGALSYNLQVSTDSAFNVLIVNNSNIKSNSYNLGPLNFMTKYYWRVGTISPGGVLEFSKTSSFQTSIPKSFTLYQNFPNPFNPTTNIRFDVPFPSFLTLKVYNSLGQLVSSLFNKKFDMGSYYYIWNATALPSGVYFITLKADNYSKTIKALLLK